MAFIDVLNNALYFVFFFFVSIDILSMLLYYLQMGGYKISALKNLFLDRIEKNYLYWFLYFVIAICLFVIRLKNPYWLSLVLVVSFVVMMLLGNRFQGLKNIKYTKRMCRLIIVSLLYLALIYILNYYLVGIIIRIILFPLLYFVSYVIILLSLITLYPLEKLIGEYYIKKAKNKLNSFKKLIKIGITGSFGKTSTKEILTTILKEHFSVLSTPKSFNTPFGITKTINSTLNNLHEVFICEMGAKAKGEIKYLCDLTGVNYGIVTSVGRQHTNTFGGIEGVYKTKKELPDYLYKKSCVFNLNNVYTFQMYREYIGNKVGVFVISRRNVELQKAIFKKKYMSLKKKVIGLYRELYSFPKKDNFYAKNIECDEFGCSFDVYNSKNFLLHANTQLLGSHNIINILLSIAMARMLNESVVNIKIGLSKIAPIKARLEKFVTPLGAVVLNNGYNSNIDSAKYTVETLALFNKPHKVIITPGLVETEDDFTYNRKFGELISKFCTEVIIVKEKNKNAIWAGLSDSKFDMCKVYFAETFREAKRVIDKADSDYVFLIENDLPDNYK